MIFCKRVLIAVAILSLVQFENPNVRGQVMPAPAPIPDLPPKRPPNSVPMGDPAKFPEVKMDFPIADGPYEPTWNSIQQNYPGKEVAWLREAKFGFWVHFGPQAAGQSGDWYARRMYMQGQRAYNNHIRDFGKPSEVGYKDLLKDWNPTKLDPAKLVQTYHDAGARFLLIQGVHHDNFDNWNSTYQPWNSVNMGPKRDIIGEWSAAAHKAGMRYGVSFHDEYTWWWWQKAFGADKTGPLAGVPYDGNLTAADGKGKWWDGYDLRLLYGIDLREYQGFDQDSWCPKGGILVDHLDYCHWYATRWALRIMDVINKYDPDFIFTDGNSTQPFTGYLSATGYKCDAMQRVIADYYNHTLKAHGQVDTFSIVKFHPPADGVVTTFEDNWPRGIKTDQPWIGETANGDWFYAPGFTYNAGGMIRYMLECVSRDGCCCINIAMLPDGSLDEGSTAMLKGVGDWMKINGEAVYGSRAWVQFREGSRSLPQGFIGAAQARFNFTPDDFRFTVGKDGSIYAVCMTVPAAGTKLSITAMGTDSRYMTSPIKSVTMLGSSDPVNWKQESNSLEINCPSEMPYKIAVVFKVTCESPAQTAEAVGNNAKPASHDSVVGLSKTRKGSPNVLSEVGEYGGGGKDEEQPPNAIDGDINTKYFNQSVGLSPTPGVDSGLVITLHDGSPIVTGITFATGNDLEGRDPVAITVEGSNDPSAAAAGSNKFTLLYEGPCGLATDPGRNAWGQTIHFPNTTPFQSYRILVTQARNPGADAMQYSEVKLLRATPKQTGP